MAAPDGNAPAEGAGTVAVTASDSESSVVVVLGPAGRAGPGGLSGPQGRGASDGDPDHSRAHWHCTPASSNSKSSYYYDTSIIRYYISVITGMCHNVS